MIRPAGCSLQRDDIGAALDGRGDHCAPPVTYNMRKHRKPTEQKRHEERE